MESRWSGTSLPHHRNRNLSRQDNRFQRSGNQAKVNGNVDPNHNGNRANSTKTSSDQARSGKGPQQRNNFRKNNDRFNGNSSFGDKKQSKYAKQGFGSRTKQRKPDASPKKVKITSDLQITDGKYLGQAIENSLSPAKLPTPRAARETMFKSIARRVRAGRFLDIGAGSGVVGIEALSRGAMLVDFVERSPKMGSYIRTNLNKFEIKEGHGQIHHAEADAFLKRADINRRVWEVIYLHYHDEEDCEFALERLSDGVGTEKGGLVIIEHAKDWKSPDKVGRLHRWRVFDKSDRALSFYTHK